MNMIILTGSLQSYIVPLQSRCTIFTSRMHFTLTCPSSLPITRYAAIEVKHNYCILLFEGLQKWSVHTAFFRLFLKFWINLPLNSFIFRLQVWILICQSHLSPKNVLSDSDSVYWFMFTDSFINLTPWRFIHFFTIDQELVQICSSMCFF